MLIPLTHVTASDQMMISVIRYLIISDVEHTEAIRDYLSYLLSKAALILVCLCQNQSMVK